MTETAQGAPGMRLDRLLVYLRFARTRSAARDLIDGGALRRNREHVQRISEHICVGDVLTMMVGNRVRVIEILSLPERRQSASLAQTHYRDLTRDT